MVLSLNSDPEHSSIANNSDSDEDPIVLQKVDRVYEIQSRTRQNVSHAQNCLW